MSRIFMMGNYEAHVLEDRQYARNHMWAQAGPEGYRFGFSSYAVRLLQDVYFLDWTMEPGMALREKQEIGSIESKKAESALYAPLEGRVTRLNQDLLQDPSAINVDTYGQGWLFELSASAASAAVLLSADEYLAHLAAVWEITQRTIKGQLNE